VAAVLYYAHPLLDWVVRGIEQRRPITFHTGLYERADLIELVKQQRDLADSRIPDDELNMVLHALSFGEKTVGSIMVPRAEVVAVRDDDVIGPILMDELYDSKHSRFPVLHGESDYIIGVLYLRDLISARQGGRVGDIVKHNVQYVHDEQTLYRVLHAFLTTKQHMFVVIDSDEEYVGLVTIEDVLEQVIGHKIEDDFDSYDDRRAVAEAGGKQTVAHKLTEDDTPSLT
jgi:magnesium and cobalt transporter